MTKYLPIVALCGGCVLGAGPVVGYGKKRGFYAGATAYGGAWNGQAALEVGGTREGPAWQGRVDVEGNKLRFLSGNDEDKPYPGVRAGIGYGRSGGVGGVAATVGPDVGVMTTESKCTGSSIFYVGIDWRYIGGESQVVLAPRYEQLSDICLR